MGEAALHDDCAALAVNVAALEGDPFVRAKPCLGREDDEGAEDRAELDGERVDLLLSKRPQLVRARLRVAARVDGRVARHVPPANRSGESLP